jgi:small subunit ribosomal protein S27Ae
MTEEQAPEKQHEARASKLYDLDPGKGEIKLRNRKCPRCGNFMAHHAKPVERWTCGSCTFTEYMEKKS